MEYTPAEVIKGHDPQLERAVQEALKLLEQNPVVTSRGRRQSIACHRLGC